jgi:DNA-binding response OmpR family regulator
MARILVVDDDQVLRGALRIVLEAAGYNVMDAADGEAGLRLYHEQGADLVLVDLFMPERDGLQVIRALRAVIPQPRIVAMSGGGCIGRTEVLRAAATCGAARTLRKPFESCDLLAAIRELLGGSGPDDARDV